MYKYFAHHYIYVLIDDCYTEVTVSINEFCRLLDEVSMKYTIRKSELVHGRRIYTYYRYFDNNGNFIAPLGYVSEPFDGKSDDDSFPLL